jgi:hypothetical protein
MRSADGFPGWITPQIDLNTRLPPIRGRVDEFPLQAVDSHHFFTA